MLETLLESLGPNMEGLLLVLGLFLFVLAAKIIEIVRKN
jgi:hypothetical protein